MSSEQKDQKQGPQQINQTHSSNSSNTKVENSIQQQVASSTNDKDEKKQPGDLINLPNIEPYEPYKARNHIRQSSLIFLKNYTSQNLQQDLQSKGCETTTNNQSQQQSFLQASNEYSKHSASGNLDTVKKQQDVNVYSNSQFKKEFLNSQNQAENTKQNDPINHVINLPPHEQSSLPQYDYLYNKQRKNSKKNELTPSSKLDKKGETNSDQITQNNGSSSNKNAQYSAEKQSQKIQSSIINLAKQRSPQNANLIKQTKNETISNATPIQQDSVNLTSSIASQSKETPQNVDSFSDRIHNFSSNKKEEQGTSIQQKVQNPQFSSQTTKNNQYSGTIKEEQQIKTVQADLKSDIGTSITPNQELKNNIQQDLKSGQTQTVSVNLVDIYKYDFTTKNIMAAQNKILSETSEYSQSNIQKIKEQFGVDTYSKVDLIINKEVTPTNKSKSFALDDNTNLKFSFDGSGSKQQQQQQQQQQDALVNKYLNNNSPEKSIAPPIMLSSVHQQDQIINKNLLNQYSQPNSVASSPRNQVPSTTTAVQSNEYKSSLFSGLKSPTQDITTRFRSNSNATPSSSKEDTPQDTKLLASKFKLLYQQGEYNNSYSSPQNKTNNTTAEAILKKDANLYEKLPSTQYLEEKFDKSQNGSNIGSYSQIPQQQSVSPKPNNTLQQTQLEQLLNKEAQKRQDEQLKTENLTNQVIGKIQQTLSYSSSANQLLSKIPNNNHEQLSQFAKNQNEQKQNQTKQQGSNKLHHQSTFGEIPQIQVTGTSQSSLTNNDDKNNSISNISNINNLSNAGNSATNSISAIGQNILHGLNFEKKDNQIQEIASTGNIIHDHQHDKQKNQQQDSTNTPKNSINNPFGIDRNHSTSAHVFVSPKFEVINKVDGQNAPMSPFNINQSQNENDQFSTAINFESNTQSDFLKKFEMLKQNSKVLQQTHNDVWTPKNKEESTKPSETKLPKIDLVLNDKSQQYLSSYSANVSPMNTSSSQNKQNQPSAFSTNYGTKDQQIKSYTPNVRNSPQFFSAQNDDAQKKEEKSSFFSLSKQVQQSNNNEPASHVPDTQQAAHRFSTQQAAGVSVQTNQPQTIDAISNSLKIGSYATGSIQNSPTKTLTEQYSHSLNSSPETKGRQLESIPITTIDPKQLNQQQNIQQNQPIIVAQKVQSFKSYTPQSTLGQTVLSNFANVSNNQIISTNITNSNNSTNINNTTTNTSNATSATTTTTNNNVPVDQNSTNTGAISSILKNQQGAVVTVQVMQVKQMEMPVKFKKYVNPRSLIKFNNFFKKDQFRIGKSLGSGQFSDVNMAQDMNTGMIVALKKIKKKTLIEMKLEDYLENEIKLQIYFNHPNILKLYGFYYDEEHVILVSEYAAHGELYQELKQSPNQRFDEQKGAAYMRQICDAFQYLHNQQVIHRDIKPQNILMSFGVLKISDFGCSVYCPENRRRTFCGTLDYVSPEIVNGEAYGQRVDLWSLGILAYEILTGKSPFQQQTKQEILTNILQNNITYPSHLSDDAKELLQGLLVRDPTKRLTMEQIINHKWMTTNLKLYSEVKWDKELVKVAKELVK